MTKRKLFMVLSLFLMLGVRQTIKAQNNIVPILLNEFSASNIGSPVDNYGQQSDWVEIHNAHTQQVSLGGYYLSNDRNNLYKWKFPNTYIMGVNTYSVVWLSGKNTVSNGNYHANFTLDQCKNQWLILTSPGGVVYDSVFVMKTKEGHSWGRVDQAHSGVQAWRLYTSHSFGYSNPTVNNYRGYCPKPSIVATPASTPNASPSPSVSAGGFSPGSPLIYFKLENPVLAYDTAYHSCFNIYYTTDGSYPVAGVNQVFDSINTVITVSKAIIIRAIAVVNPTSTACSSTDYLPSFCETNTYFADPDYQIFDKDFGVLSIALEDTLWFNSNGLPNNSKVHVEYYDKKMQVTEGYGLLNRPPNEGWKTTQKGFNITIDDKQGFGCGFEGNIFNVDGLGTSSRTVFPTLQVYAGDNESLSPPLLGPSTATAFGTGLRDVFMQSLAVKYNLNVNPLHVKPIIVFRNGAYYGTYTFKEVYDKYYENYYHHQSKDSLDLPFYHNTDGYVSYDDGSISRFSPTTAFKTGVYDLAVTRPLTSSVFYGQLTSQLDVSSLMDYVAVNSYALNSDLWAYNIAYARGGQASKPGNKWHYYLWNMPSIFNFSAVPNNPTFSYGNSSFSTCVLYTNSYPVSPYFAGNGHGVIMNRLMQSTPNTGNAGFQEAYKNRYQDLLNTAFKCENILKHFDYINELYANEMHYHEDPARLGAFATAVGVWDTNMVRLRGKIKERCEFVAKSFSNKDCYGLTGPYDILVNVEPVGAGTVKLNSILLDTYPWTGTYYGERVMGFKAVPTNTTFIFDHWEFKNNHPYTSLTLDTITSPFAQPDEVLAVFTDKTRDIQSGVNVPTGFTPNGDGINDTFGPLGSALFSSDYEMSIWNRWGQEVYHTTSPSDQWDGYYKGQQALTGVYAYIMKYKNIFGDEKLLKGNVTLTR